jgi:FkbM family methyltransferase
MSNVGRLLVHSAKYVLSREYRSISRLRLIPRYTPFKTDLPGVRITAVDSVSFIHAYTEIFKRGIYRFESGSAAPNIVDCGANIGLSVIYFKQLYPNARITAFEADPKVFDVLSANVRSLGLENTTLHNKAIWNQEATLDFFTEGADAGRVTSSTAEEKQVCKVSAVPLRDYLSHEKIDLLKIDIEGAETVVLKSCADCLSNVQRIFVEYHSFEDKPQELHELLTILHNAGFRIHAQPVGFSEQPFVKRQTYLGMDMQFNVFASRDWIGS